MMMMPFNCSCRNKKKSLSPGLTLSMSLSRCRYVDLEIWHGTVGDYGSRLQPLWVWIWDWIHSHTPPRTRSPSSRQPPFTHCPFPLRSLVCGGQPSPHNPRLVVSHSTYTHTHMSSTILLPPRAQLCIRYCNNKNTHTLYPQVLQ